MPISASRRSGRSGQQQRQHERRQHGEQQAPFDQPAQGEERCDQRDAQVRRPVEPQAGQGHRAQHQRVARHDVLADHREQQDEAAAEMEAGGQRGRADAAGQAMDEGVDDDGGEAGEDGVEPGELPPRHAAIDAEPVEQPAERAVEREIEIVRGIEPRPRRIGDPGLGLDALVHAVGGDDVDVLQPRDQAAERHQAEREGQQEMRWGRATPVARLRLNQTMIARLESRASSITSSVRTRSPRLPARSSRNAGSPWAW